ncbi:MAG: hypothetical protein IT371_28380 [Deltaproteobacteria bacterium]|nr:hypothetical protein [Deltaproteobacteria bacterium]
MRHGPGAATEERPGDPLVLGIDEAGRGPLLGPLVLCGVRASPAARSTFARLGLLDSKAYGSTAAGKLRRARLAEEIRAHAEVAVRVAEAAEVDRWVQGAGLNALEQDLARELIADGAAPTRIVADGARLFGPLRAERPELEALDRAESVELAVAAASIVAKAERDARLAAELGPYEAEFGPIRGGGYCNAGTLSFLRAYGQCHGVFPACVRTSWRWPELLALRRELGLEDA